jgi:hypothetical protein
MPTCLRRRLTLAPFARTGAFRPARRPRPTGGAGERRGRAHVPGTALIKPLRIKGEGPISCALWSPLLRATSGKKQRSHHRRRQASLNEGNIHPGALQRGQVREHGRRAAAGRAGHREQVRLGAQVPIGGFAHGTAEHVEHEFGAALHDHRHQLRQAEQGNGLEFPLGKRRR